MNAATVWTEVHIPYPHLTQQPAPFSPEGCHPTMEQFFPVKNSWFNPMSLSMVYVAHHASMQCRMSMTRNPFLLMESTPSRMP